MEQQIVHLRLINGDEVIGDFMGLDTELKVKIKTPMVVTESVHPKTQISTIVLSSYNLYNNDTVNFKQEHIITLTPVIREIEEYYNHSVTYHKKVIAKSVRNELQKVNENMKTQLETLKHIKKVVPDEEDEPIIYIPEGNTFH